MVARRRWHRARAAHEAAVQAAQEEVKAATVATEAWLSLVRAVASAVTGDDADLVPETAALGAALLAALTRAVQVLELAGGERWMAPYGLGGATGEGAGA
jgi:hypothetical protein